MIGSMHLDKPLLCPASSRDVARCPPCAFHRSARTFAHGQASGVASVENRGPLCTHAQTHRRLAAVSGKTRFCRGVGTELFVSEVDRRLARRPKIRSESGALWHFAFQRGPCGLGVGRAVVEPAPFLSRRSSLRVSSGSHRVICDPRHRLPRKQHRSSERQFRRETLTVSRSGLRPTVGRPPDCPYSGCPASLPQAASTPTPAVPTTRA